MPLVKPNKYNSEKVCSVLEVSTRKNKLGEIYYYVEFSSDGVPYGFRFDEMSSVIDFIKSNFR